MIDIPLMVHSEFPVNVEALLILAWQELGTLQYLKLQNTVSIVNKMTESVEARGDKRTFP